MFDSWDDDQLLKRSATDADAFAVFYRRHARSVLMYLRSRTHDMETAADLTADVFAAAFGARSRYRPAREPARAWLFGIANNRLAMSRRKQRRAAAARRRLGIGSLGVDDAAYERAEEQWDAQAQAGILHALLDDLPSDQRAAVVARVVHDQPYPQIASEQQASEATIRQRVSRGLARLELALRKESQ